MHATRHLKGVYKPLIPLNMLPYSPAVKIIIMCHYLLQRLSRSYRDDTYHAAIDTNKGTEAQNKLLKYSYMPKQKSMTLSGIACLLVDQFLPDAHRNYVLANVKVTEWYRRYKNFVPEFLRGRPRSVILHCLDRQTKARKYDVKDDVTSTTSEGVFEVNKSNGSKHVVDFGCDTSSPSCTYKDRIHWHMPCKHFFAVFDHVPEWNWSSLPLSYLDSAYLSMDADVIHTYFQPEDSTSDLLDHEPSVEIGERDETDCDALENPPSKKKVITSICLHAVLQYVYLIMSMYVHVVTHAT